MDTIVIAFSNIRSPEPDALPVMMTHGWPGSAVEFNKVVGPPSPIPSRTAAGARTRSTSCCRLCPAVVSRTGRPRRDGASPASQTPGSS
ncbi:epoxide hydrolase N-terminal domain-containing protein [uncultured Sphingomonas sp.]|uniref:epoxide hydrolase N-terminal domain-containing protein n=1 Tax=uncultured Sphingomonas sp. TaxID=158754 RepID=UPI0035CAF4AC